MKYQLLCTFLSYQDFSKFIQALSSFANDSRNAYIHLATIDGKHLVGEACNGFIFAKETVGIICDDISSFAVKINVPAYLPTENDGIVRLGRTLDGNVVLHYVDSNVYFVTKQDEIKAVDMTKMRQSVAYDRQIRIGFNKAILHQAIESLGDGTNTIALETDGNAVHALRLASVDGLRERFIMPRRLAE